MFQKNKFLSLIAIISLIVACSTKPEERNKAYDVVVTKNEISQCYIFGDNKISYELISKKDSKGNVSKVKDLLLGKYNLITPLLPIKNKEFLVSYSGELFIYNLNGEISSSLTNISNFDKIYYFQNRLILVLENQIMILKRSMDNEFVLLKEFDIVDKEVFNIYGMINTKHILIEAGFFPSGGCESINYYNINLNDFSFEKCSDKIKLILDVNNPIDEYYMDVTQSYFFFPCYKKYGTIKLDDYILDENFDIIGRALKKYGSYTERGYSINNNDDIEYYFWGIEKNRYVCFPVNLNFEKQIYKTYYDSVLVKTDLEQLEKFEIKLLKNTILLKNDCIIESDKIRNILALYAFSFNYEENKTEDKIEVLLEGNEKLNFELLNTFFQ